jgi:hypothetical protein
MWTSLHEGSVFLFVGAGAGAGAEVDCAGADAGEEAGTAVGALACHEKVAPLYVAVIHSPPLLLLLLLLFWGTAETEGMTAGGVDWAGTFQLFSHETVFPSITAVTQSARFSRGAGAPGAA